MQERMKKKLWQIFKSFSYFSFPTLSTERMLVPFRCYLLLMLLLLKQFFYWHFVELHVRIERELILMRDKGQCV